MWNTRIELDEMTKLRVEYAAKLLGSEPEQIGKSLIIATNAYLNGRIDGLVSAASSKEPIEIPKAVLRY